MRYVRGIVGNDVGLGKHAETCRRGEAKHREELSLGPEERTGETAENGVDDFQDMFDLGHVHFRIRECCKAWVLEIGG